MLLNSRLKCASSATNTFGNITDAVAACYKHLLPFASSDAFGGLVRIILIE